MKLLKNKSTGLIRALVRAEKTHKVVVNHLLQAKDIFCKLEKMNTSNNAWSWAGYDISDEKPATEKFCAKFTSKDDFEKFKEEFEKACESNAKVLAELKAKEEAAEK
jgi:Ran-binding protein 1